VADINWGCDSSRENAANALVANDIVCMIAQSFGDIQYINCIKNGILPGRLPAENCARLRAQLGQSPSTEIAMDLDSQIVTGPDQQNYPLEIKNFDK
jgi:3-isopropylmalate/(R)-2-methylmalate dehydratase small subunit